MTPTYTGRAAIWLGIGAGLILIVCANAHLVYVAVTSQPTCVAHVRAGDGTAPRDAYGAAESACAPARPTHQPP